MIDKEMLAMLVCPETRTPLRQADATLVARLNEAIAAGALKNKVGQLVKSQIDGGLVRQDRTVLYPIVDGIPVMLADEAIPLDESLRPKG